MSQNKLNFTSRFFIQLDWMNYYLKKAIECKIFGDTEGFEWYKKEMKCSLLSAKAARFKLDMIF